MQKAPVKGIMI